MPKVLGWVTEKIRQPLIAGGLVCDEEDARNAINAGVVAPFHHEYRGLDVSEKIALTGYS